MIHLKCAQHRLVMNLASAILASYTSSEQTVSWQWQWVEAGAGCVATSSVYNKHRSFWDSIIIDEVFDEVILRVHN